MAYLVVFLFAFAEATAVIGLVVPGTTAVAAAGSAARLGKMNYRGVAIAAALGVGSRHVVHAASLSLSVGEIIPRERWGRRSL